ncbi:MAG: hypothetical protein MJ156_00765 [Alphaproteobacteria bacterium]|nr:hypothetical protein [Alphaproteobacteria bacterium]
MKLKSLLFLILSMCIFFETHALEYNLNKFNFKLDLEGMAGILESKKDKPLFINDWDVKGQAFYKINSNHKLGLVYSLDADCVEEDEYIHDAFMLYENKKMGRAELGLTYSVIRKMGLGLPDVGYLRINERSIIYKKLHTDKTFIADTTATTGHEALRINLATTNTAYGQYGLSVSGITDNYKYGIDFAYKYKQSSGKLKTAYSFGISLIDKPENYVENSFTNPVTSDWRSQLALGVNLQYNSWIFGISSRVIYDKNPITQPTDGFIAGTGISYDVLSSSFSVSYLFSNTGIWKHNNYDKQDLTNTILASYRYKYTNSLSMFVSGGIADTSPFISAGLKIEF